MRSGCTESPQGASRPGASGSLGWSHVVRLLPPRSLEWRPPDSRPGGTEVGLDAAAARAGYSRFHFGRLFRTVTGTTFHRYLLRLRHREALRRLAAGAEDLTGLALELGFSSHSHFTTSFRGEYGLAPSEARARFAPVVGERAAGREALDLRSGA